MIGIDLFAGAGGMSLGAQMAGVRTSLCIENDPHAIATYIHNHPKTKIFHGDVRKVGECDVSVRRKTQNEQIIVFGGPPCQGFSTSNQRTRTSENQSNWLFKEFIRIVDLCRPDWVVFENVKGILETEGGRFVDYTLQSLEKLGYLLSFDVLNAVDYGVPQIRSRFFIVGNLHGINFKFPKPTTRTPVTVSEAISDLPSLQNGATEGWLEYMCPPISKYAHKMRRGLEKSPNHFVTRNAKHIIERYKYIPQGGNWESIPKSMMQNYSNVSRCHTGIYKRLKADTPSVVIGNYRKNMLVHPWEDRGLSVREAARLQSFPDWYEFKGSIGFQQQQVGNAVPPFMAKAIFHSIIKHSR